MINFAFIEKIFSLRAFKKLLTDKVLGAFNVSYSETNEVNNFTSKANPAVLDYFKERELILSEKTMARLHGNLKYEILEGIQNRESITDIKKKIAPMFDNFKDFELDRLVRTEVSNAQNAGEFHSQLAGGIATHKQWLAHKDARTGGDSLRLHNQIVKIDEEFEDYKTGDTCMYPPSRPNCRCSILYLYEMPKKTVKKHGLIYKK